MSTAPSDHTPSAEPANCHIGLRYGTRERLAALQAKMRKAYGHFISYDKAITLLIDRYEGHRPNPIKENE